MYVIYFVIFDSCLRFVCLVGSFISDENYVIFYVLFEVDSCLFKFFYRLYCCDIGDINEIGLYG